ncbi:phage tail sheath family protein [Actinomycetospora chibensis]|uniref:Phage tail sheath family protein n=1 Tax=Actinomycetospora chibensis TaxID=663606 RepID=A0ABV9RPM2_9PSEU|nr:phage tail sheath C-terminal domain-containing protein [Actinomycetospora chibensis]MDD7926971.1 phage tail sheath subtilisin-like domain-containing protein [Actinomycetospora chibensis]
MPSALTFPGVYVEEIPSGVRPITGVSTANTAFVDYFRRGPMNVPTRITSLADFDRTFGGIDAQSEASYGIAQYYLNGGSVAWVLRVAGGTGDNAPKKATLTFTGKTGDDTQDSLVFSAASEGTWANKAIEVAAMHVTPDPDEEPPADPPPADPPPADPPPADPPPADPPPADPSPARDEPFNIFVRELALDANGQPVVDGTGAKVVLRFEAFRGLSMEANSPNFVASALRGSELVTVRVADPKQVENQPPVPAPPPTTTNGGPTGNPTRDSWFPLGNGSNGTVPASATDLLGASEEHLRTLDTIAPEVFNILCLPAAARKGVEDTARKDIYDKALRYCITKRAFLLVDIPGSVTTPAGMRRALNNITTDNHSAVYFPRLSMPDPLDGGQPRDVAASGTIAGIYGRTDVARGAWKAPAGTEAVIVGADLATVISDDQSGQLNPLGVNVLRNFPIFGNIVWGARTLDGADTKASEWKYIPVRRTALFIEESLFQALKWVVFEPNDEGLWAQIRLNVGAFMNNLFRQGAFQGRTSRDAYFVKVDKDTTTQNDIDNGIVNVVVGFAPLKPAEFVVLKIQQMAGQVQV